MKRGVYICIEGLDGCGKSTLFNLLRKYLEENKFSFTNACPTKAICENWVERLYKKNIFLKNSSFFRAILYALRSKNVAKNTDWKCPLVLGDRSLVTSYVTRWKKWINSRWLTIIFVDILEPFIPAPDHVIYIDLPQDILRARLSHRDEPLDIDETLQRSEEMRQAYNEIFNSSIIPRLSKTQWHKLSLITPNDSLEEVLKATLELLKRINII